MFPNDTQPQVIPKVKKAYFISFVVSVVMVIVLLSFGIWAYLGKKDAQSNLDSQINDAVKVAEEELTTELTAQFDEDSKIPYRSVNFSENLGGITFQFPKNWSVYAVDKDSGAKPLDVYAHPNVVPNISGETAFGLRLQIVDKDYEKVVGEYDNEIEKGSLSSKAIKSNSVLGVKLQGSLEKDVSGLMVIFPLRDKTLMLWTESTTFKNEFETSLGALVFTP